MTTAAYHIAQSVNTNSIVTVRATDIELGELCDVADDWVELTDMGSTYVWGTTESGDDWRIRVLTTECQSEVSP